ncbi:MAG: hypothetical protein ACJ8DC_00030 [Gemmatimonadales bacterium]
MSHRVMYLVVLLPLSAAHAGEHGDTIRICLGPTTVEAAVGSAATAASAVREAFSSFLAGPSIGATPLTARLQSQAREEARQAGCRYLLLTTMKHEQKHGGGFMRRMVGSAAQQGAWTVGASAGSVAGRVAAGAAYGAAGTAAYDYATSVRTKDEMTLQYRLEDASGAVLAEHADKRKANSDGEDLLGPLAQQQAEAIVAVVGKRGQ